MYLVNERSDYVRRLTWRAELERARSEVALARAAELDELRLDLALVGR